ncbi:hypothetical protein HOLleu_17503 [Holothuria leucospilota]|uniref:Uncharacterized protein n=1 Tax=Holothuria leucospilota TaxID=206669 RepID=A0A9Q1C1G5_HOLLE|nr:hypothetical protein HOLleu_17503 [Holothuria leucospilota]
MGRISSACGIICVLLILWAEQCPGVNTQPEANFCVLRTQEGVEIRASLKPSLNAQQKLHQTLDLTNARCCFNPDKKCALTEHLNVTLNNITSLLKYPIHPLWCYKLLNEGGTCFKLMSKCAALHFVRHILNVNTFNNSRYSFYEFGKPSLTQTVDVQITRKTSFNSKETFSVHLRSEKSASTTTQTETPSRLMTNPHRSPEREEDRILIEDVFLLIPEVKDNMKKDSQTRRGARDYLVLNQSLFEFPNSDCFSEKTRFLSLVVPQHRPCVEASSVDLEKQPYDFYVKEKYLQDWFDCFIFSFKVKEIRNGPTEFFLDSFGTLYDPTTTSRHRSSVIFISQQPLILHIFIPNEETSSRSRAPEFFNTVCGTIALYSRQLGSFLNDQCSLIMATIRNAFGIISAYLVNLHSSHLEPFLTDLFTFVATIIRDAYNTIFEYSDTLYSRHLGPFLTDRWTLVTATSGAGYDVIAQHLQPLATFIKGQWSSAVEVLYIFLSFDKFDSISFEKSIVYQWNLIWSYIDHACQKIGVLRADGDATVAAGWIILSVLIGKSIRFLFRSQY